MLVSRLNLKHGDVLLFQKRKHAGFLPRAIRLITGSKFSHAGIVVDLDGNLVVLEQLIIRHFSLLRSYSLELSSSDVVMAFRPKFEVNSVNIWDLRIRSYGILSLIDELINHGLSNLTFRHWRYRAIFGNKVNIVCSALVAKILELEQNTDWCKDHRLVEPGDLANHPENFELLGEVIF
jgi:hypothetical protein